MRGEKKESKKFQIQSSNSSVSTLTIYKTQFARTRCTTQGNTLRTDTQREGLSEVHPGRRSPEHREGEDVKDSEGDQNVPALFVPLSQCYGTQVCARRRNGEVPHKSGLNNKVKDKPYFAENITDD